MNGVGEMSGSAIGHMIEPRMQAKPNLAARFLKLDVDGSGGLDSVELSVEAKKLSEMTGMPINVQETFAAYDANDNDSLDQSEMRNMIRGVLGPPPDEMFVEYNEDSDVNDAEGLDEDKLAAFTADFEEQSGQAIDVRV